MKIVIIFALVVVGAIIAIYFKHGNSIAKEKSAREAVIEKYPELFSSISGLMFKHDPIGINFETNTDEYDPEAGTVIPKLENAKNSDEAITIVHNEFIRWFGKDTAGDRSRYIILGQEIWILWREKS